LTIASNRRDATEKRYGKATVRAGKHGSGRKIVGRTASLVCAGSTTFAKMVSNTQVTPSVKKRTTLKDSQKSHVSSQSGEAGDQESFAGKRGCLLSH